MRLRSWLVVLCVLAIPCPATAAVREWRFDVTADGVSIGTHTYVVRDENGERTVQSDMRFRVRLFVVDAYRFEHHAIETWRSDCLTSLETRTEERAATTVVSGRRVDGRFEIDGADGPAELPACVMTFAYWNPKVLDQTHLVNAQTGVWTPISVQSLGDDAITVQDQPRDARRYRITTEKNRIELWYAKDTGDWLAMRATTQNGHVLAYALH